MGMLFSGGFNDAKWKPKEVRECRFVFIGKNLDKAKLMEGVMACQVKGELRFKVGDEVEAKVSGWKRGKILHLWYDGNPYVIELADKKKTTVFGPQDDDRYVRA